MPGPFAVDASVFLNAFNPRERGSQVSQALLAQLQAEGVPLIAPALLLPECAAALSRGQNDPELVRRFALTLARLPGLILLPLDELLATQAVEMAAAGRLRGCDAVYAAAAQRFACPLLTLDREQHDRLASLMKTYTPEELLTTDEKFAAQVAEFIEQYHPALEELAK
jgi:predicted nucleic acid-binding protein